MKSSGLERNGGKRLRWVVAGVMVLLVGAGVGWAAAVVLTPPEDVLSSTKFTYVRVVEGEVGSTLNLNTVAEWTPVPIGSNLAVGTVTTVDVSPGQEVGQGSVLYTVNLRPVVVAQGNVPSFQSLSRGATGADVAQLQSMLGTLGFYEYAADGVFDSATQGAVETWQESLGVDDDGTVRQGDIVFVPTLPTRVALDVEKIKRGASVGGGEEVVQGLTSTPTFTIPATPAQAALMPIGTRVQITGPAGEMWEGFVADQKSNDKDGVTVTLAGKDGGAICLEACADVPVTGQALLRSKIVTVEPVTGLTVPSAALLSTADGSLAVIDGAGVRHKVTVVTSARGMSVIDGVEAGTKVRVPAAGQ